MKYETGGIGETSRVVKVLKRVMTKDGRVNMYIVLFKSKSYMPHNYSDVPANYFALDTNDFKQFDDFKEAAKFAATHDGVILKTVPYYEVIGNIYENPELLNGDQPNG